MNIDFFITKFGEQFDETDISCINSSTKFKELEEWSSLIALSVIVMIDQEFSTRIDGDDIRSSDTVGDLFDIVNSRRNV